MYLKRSFTIPIPCSKGPSINKDTHFETFCTTSIAWPVALTIAFAVFRASGPKSLGSIINVLPSLHYQAKDNRRIANKVTCVLVVKAFDTVLYTEATGFFLPLIVPKCSAWRKAKPDLFIPVMLPFHGKIPLLPSFRPILPEKSPPYRINFWVADQVK